MGERSSQLQMAWGTFLSWVCWAPVTGTLPSVSPRAAPALVRSSRAPPCPLSPRPPLLPRAPPPRHSSSGVLLLSVVQSHSVPCRQFKSGPFRSCLNPPWRSGEGLFRVENPLSILRTEGSCGCTVSPCFTRTDPLRHPVNNICRSSAVYQVPFRFVKQRHRGPVLCGFTLLAVCTGCYEQRAVGLQIRERQVWRDRLRWSRWILGWQFRQRDLVTMAVKFSSNHPGC